MGPIVGSTRSKSDSLTSYDSVKPVSRQARAKKKCDHMKVVPIRKRTFIIDIGGLTIFALFFEAKYKPIIALWAQGIVYKQIGSLTWGNQ
jgi:hypothetical protein